MSEGETTPLILFYVLLGIAGFCFYRIASYSRKRGIKLPLPEGGLHRKNTLRQVIILAVALALSAVFIHTIRTNGIAALLLFGVGATALALQRCATKKREYAAGVPLAAPPPASQEPPAQPSGRLNADRL
jgi:hypothetical protein